MSKTLSKFTFPGEFKTLQRSVKTLGKTVRILSKIFEVYGASAKASKEIDEAVIIATGELSPEELNGLLISDPQNKTVLVRQEGIWNTVFVGDTGWKTISLENSWTNFITSQYRIIGNRYWLRGSLFPTGSSGTIAFKLLKGPTQEALYSCAPGIQTTPATVVISNTGEVKIIYSSGTTSVTIDDISYTVD